MDDYRRAQKGQHNYARKFAKSGERRAVFQRDTEDEVDDQMEDQAELTKGIDITAELAVIDALPAIIPRASNLLDGRQHAMANDIYLATNRRKHLYMLMINSLSTVVRNDRSRVDRDSNKFEFNMILDEIRQGFRDIPEFREAVFWLKPEAPSLVRKTNKALNLRLEVKRKLAKYLNVKWLA